MPGQAELTDFRQAPRADTQAAADYLGLPTPEGVRGAIQAQLPQIESPVSQPVQGPANPLPGQDVHNAEPNALPGRMPVQAAPAANDFIRSHLVIDSPRFYGEPEQAGEKAGEKRDYGTVRADGEDFTVHTENGQVFVNENGASPEDALNSLDLVRQRPEGDRLACVIEKAATDLIGEETAQDAPVEQKPTGGVEAAIAEEPEGAGTKPVEIDNPETWANAVKPEAAGAVSDAMAKDPGGKVEEIMLKLSDRRELAAKAKELGAPEDVLKHGKDELIDWIVGQKRSQGAAASASEQETPGQAVKPLERMTRDELLAEARKLEIGSLVRNRKKQDIIDRIRKEQKERQRDYLGENADGDKVFVNGHGKRVIRNAGGEETG